MFAKMVLKFRSACNEIFVPFGLPLEVFLSGRFGFGRGPPART